MDGETRTWHGLQRREDGKMIAGVCAGIAEHVGVDPSVVRLVAVVAVVCGAGVLVPLYLVAAWIVPAAPASGATSTPFDEDDPSVDLGWRTPRPTRRRERPTSRRTIGWLLVGAGAFALVDRLGWVEWELVVSVALVALGVNLLVRDRADRD